MGLLVNWVHNQSWEKSSHGILYLALGSLAPKKQRAHLYVSMLSSQALKDFVGCLPTFLVQRYEWILFIGGGISPLCVLNYSTPINEASMEADTSLWCFFIERRDSSGSVSSAITNQEENDQICLFHIWKSCSFQGKSQETPWSTYGWNNCFSLLELCSEATHKVLFSSRGGRPS